MLTLREVVETIAKQGCTVSWPGWVPDKHVATCLDVMRDAIARPDCYGTGLQRRLAAGESLCDRCRCQFALEASSENGPRLTPLEWKKLSKHLDGFSDLSIEECDALRTKIRAFASV